PNKWAWIKYCDLLFLEKPNPREKNGRRVIFRRIMCWADVRFAKELERRCCLIITNWCLNLPKALQTDFFYTTKHWDIMATRMENTWPFSKKSEKSTVLTWIHLLRN